MPYGLSNSPSVFLNFMNKIFQKMLNKFVIIYIEDILIYSSSLTEHKRHVTQVLQRLCTHHLYLELEKYEFHRSTIQFLGYILTSWPQPTTVKELQGFLGFANFYRCFITQYSQITAPLTSFSTTSQKFPVLDTRGH